MRVFRFLMTLAAIAIFAPGVLLAGDQEIAQEIVNKLQEQRQTGTLNGFSIDLEVEDGVVWMSGRVASSDQQALALTVAQRTPGVTQVVNDLSIAAPAATTASNGTGSSKGVISGMSSAISSAFFGKSEESGIQQVQAQEAITQQAAPNYGPTVGSGVAMRSPQQLQAPPSIPRMANNQGGHGYSGAYAGNRMPVGFSRATPVGYEQYEGGASYPNQPVPMYGPGSGMGVTPARYDHPYMPNYAWPSYAAYPNYAAVTYPKQYSPTAWPYIGPFYPYPQVPLGWRKVTLEWDDGWWMLDFKNRRHSDK